jgi:hypothetical protein
MLLSVLPLAPSRSSAQRKLAWGVESVKTLQAEADTYRSRKAYAFDTERDVRAPNEVHFRCFGTEVEAPPDHWPLLAGDAIQNIRSALDHCVWAAWRSVKTNTGDGNHTQFVICNDTDCWDRYTWHLKGVPAPVRALVERSQPYNRWPQAPADDTLAILARLSNADKHRTLNVVAAAVEFEMVGVVHPVKIEQWNPATGKRLGEGRTEIATFVAVSDTPFDPMQVSPEFTYDVAIEGMSLSMLKGFVHDVFRIVVEAETGSRPHPLASYPL